MTPFFHWSTHWLAGLAATLILTTSLSICRILGLTRMDFSLMLGTAFTYNRDRAKLIGFLLHFLIGWAFSFLYILFFMQIDRASLFWVAPLLGFVHSLFLLTVGMDILPSLHPRMASEEIGPQPTRQLEPPGYLALNYGRQTPISTILAHVAYGSILGLLYH